MKKLLALVLALVMTLGLATVGTNAATDYKDADKINYKEAVDVMSAIGVLKGDESGFRPGDTLKRSEGAKIIAYLLLGNTAAEGLTGSGNKFTDVPASHWAAGYIEYLASDKVQVLNGVGGGKFDPDGQLTTTQFAKMLLVALGYDTEIEYLVGPDWAINSQKLANKNDLFKGNDEASANAAITREEAALYAFNTLKTPMVEYDNTMRVANGEGSTIVIGNSNSKPVVTEATYRNNISRKTASINGNNPQVMVEFGEEHYHDLILVNQGSRPNDLGQPTNKWTYKNLEIGTYVDEGSKIATFTKKATAKDIYEAVGKSSYDSLTDNQTWLVAYEDGVQRVNVGKNTGTNATTANVANFMHRTDTTKVMNTGNGSVTEVFQDEDNNITIVTYHTYVYQVSGDYNKSVEGIYIEPVGDTADLVPTLASSETTIKTKDFPIVADLKDDDYVLVTVADGDHDGVGTSTIQTVDKAELLTGKVDGVKVEDSLTVDGTEYKYSNKTQKQVDATIGDGVKSTEYSVGQETSLVLDKYGYVIAIDEAVTNPNYVFISKFGSSTGLGTDLVASAYFTDGTKAEITVEEAYNDNLAPAARKITANIKAAVNAANAGVQYSNTEVVDNSAAKSFDVKYAGWYTYSKTGSKYTLYTPKVGDKLQDAAAYVSGAANEVVMNDNKVNPVTGGTSGANTIATILNMDGNNGMANLKTNSKTVYVVLNETDDSVNVYTGTANSPKIVSTAVGQRAFVMGIYDVAGSGYTKCIFVATNMDVDDGGNEALLYVFGNEGTYRRAGNELGYKWRVILEDGTIGTVNATKSAPAVGAVGAGTAAGAGAFYRVSKNSDGEITDAKTITVNAGGFTANTGTATNKGKYFQNLSINTGVAGDIEYNNSTLVIDGQGFSIAKDAKITLVVLKTAPQILDDKGADREATRVTASTLAARLRGYSCMLDIQGRLTDKVTDGNTEIQELYVTVWGMSAVTIAGGGDVTSELNAALNTAGVAAVTVNNNATISANVTIPAGKAVTFNGNLTVASGTLTVSGATTVNGDLTINGTATVNNPAALLTVNGATIINGNSLVVTAGTVDLKSDVTVNGKFTTDAGTMVHTGDMTISAQASNKVDFKGTTNVQGTLTVNATGVKNEGHLYATTLTANKTVTNTGTVSAVTTNGDAATKVSGGTTDTNVYSIAADTSVIAIAIV